MANIEDTLAHLGEEDRQRFTDAIGKVGKAFQMKTGIDVDPKTIAGLATIRDHVLTGGEYPLGLAESIEALKRDTDVSNALIAAEIERAEVSKINEDIANLRPQQRINYARANGLDRPRTDTTSSMTRNEHDTVLASLSPQQRINYARKHGLT
ncbi:hypothetical protein FIU89_09830 [Roseovarius sp. THAF27]|uniref:hypothetical protein n=1 Tax=Roseovarius sp. THAF27 TaxID=2587850 RepID=UPI0012686F9E|nr:hypothetical protein [Roseovarius sp. THAF27]QFT80907.1 hypothetical protein FIU89_09830 [Roseovarius sp. THAF27]